MFLGTSKKISSRGGGGGGMPPDPLQGSASGDHSQSLPTFKLFPATSKPVDNPVIDNDTSCLCLIVHKRFSMQMCQIALYI